MSVDYYLVSETEAIHVAQDGMSGYTFYHGEKDCMRKLGEFLDRNRNGQLRFLDEHIAGDLIDDVCVKEITWSPNHREPK